MPVQVQCNAIVIRNEALDRCLDGGSANFGSIAPNAFSYSDDRLSQASFMSPLDAEEFAKSLELRGLNRDPLDPEFVIVYEHNHSVNPPCDWLILFEYEKRLIATLAGSDSRQVIAPQFDQGYDPHSTRHYSAEEIEKDFEFVERDGVIDVYREKATGTLVYHTRKTETPDELHRQAFESIWNHRREPGRPPVNDVHQAVLSEAIEKLQSLAARDPNVASVYLGLGLAWFAKGHHDRATQAYQRGAELEPENTVILKEWSSVHLSDHEFDSALKICQRAVAVTPDAIDLLGNFAVTQLLCGQIENAQKTIGRAIQLDATDQVNRVVQSIVDDVTTGRRECPRTLQAMMQKPKPKSFFARLFSKFK